MSDEPTIENDDDLRRERQALEFRIEEYLRRCGWTHTSDTPGCYWVWKREYKGQTILVDKKMALGMQGHLEEEETA